MKNNSLLKISHLDAGYGAIQVLWDINLEVKEKEVVCVIGANGAGKSTTIKMLTGILAPTSGEARVLGFVPWKQREKYVRHIGVIFGQKSQLWWDLPPLDTFHLLKEIYEINEKEFEENLPVSRFLKNVVKTGRVLYEKAG